MGQGDVWWADLAEPSGSSPGFLPRRATGLSRDSVANVSQVVTLDKADLSERVGRLSRSKLELVLAGLDTMLGR